MNAGRFAVHYIPRSPPGRVPDGCNPCASIICGMMSWNCICSRDEHAEGTLVSHCSHQDGSNKCETWRIRARRQAANHRDLPVSLKTLPTPEAASASSCDCQGEKICSVHMRCMATSTSSSDVLTFALRCPI
ncbi:hypothetical protein PYCCODRAFT_456480 [Trametes coccinea BRFM310]|uniref:Uncharacterized protein n=1 Tax=Trametes coccinea (strain BRFM310) TaxID=1353009 RepID=A0A1Y2IMP5_TRAC3|nr:hypothetical protein PYCCODRAFT_456480 [Trametes coccinea BRFM310]